MGRVGWIPFKDKIVKLLTMQDSHIANNDGKLRIPKISFIIKYSIPIFTNLTGISAFSFFNEFLNSVYFVLF